MTPSASGERQGDSPTSTPTSVRVYIPTLSWTRMSALMQMLELIWIPALTQIPALMPTRTPSYHLICYVVFILLTVSSSSLTLMRRFVAHVILGSEVHFVGVIVRLRATAQHLTSPRTPSLLSLELLIVISHLLAVESFVAFDVASGGQCQTGKTQCC